ncbi:MAG TPA: hypothetical protein V6C57_19970 [Coleofasciculaceae cyanobacterium]
MNPLYQAAALALGTVALLSLSNCATDATNSTPAALSSAEAESPVVSVAHPTAAPVTDTAASTRPIAQDTSAQDTSAQNPASLLSADQKKQLFHLNVPILVPTFLPADFRLTKVDAGEEQLVNGSYSYYSILYQGDHNTCLEISTGVDPAMSTAHLSKTLVTLPLGEATVYSGEVEGRSMIMGNLVAPPQGYMLRSGLVVRPAESKPDGSWTAAEWCQPVNMETFTQVLQSLETLEAKANTANPSLAANPIPAGQRQPAQALSLPPHSL